LDWVDTGVLRIREAREKRLHMLGRWLKIDWPLGSTIRCCMMMLMREDVMPWR
jgi:hypothetical protein